MFFVRTTQRDSNIQAAHIIAKGKTKSVVLGALIGGAVTITIVLLSGRQDFQRGYEQGLADGLIQNETSLEQMEEAFEVGFEEGRIIADLILEEEYNRGFESGYIKGLESGTNAISASENDIVPDSIDNAEEQVEERVSLNRVAPQTDVIGRDPQAQHQDTALIGGETFRDVLVLGRFQSGDTFSPASIHNLGREYTRLVGYAGRVDGTSLRYATIIFWGDDDVFLGDIEIEPTSFEVPFSVDVEGVRRLKIELVIGGGSADSIPLYAIQAFLE